MRHQSGRRRRNSQDWKEQRAAELTTEGIIWQNAQQPHLQMQWLSIKHVNLDAEQDGGDWEAESTGAEANGMVVNNVLT